MRPSRKYLSSTQIQSLFGPLETLVAFHQHLLAAMMAVIDDGGDGDGTDNDMRQKMQSLGGNRTRMDACLDDIGALFLSLVRRYDGC
jgi:hypothetical protein